MPFATLSQHELKRRILFEDEDVVAVDKPWGLPSTGRRLNDPDSLQFALVQRYVSMTWAIHQLDADTSGINVFVRRRHLVKLWQTRMRSPTGEKSYLAVLHGEMADDCTIQAPIGSIQTSPTRHLGVTADGRSALTHFEVLDRRGGFSLVRAKIETGRTHQIRIHASSIGHPLVGEAWYRDTPCRRHPRQALHACELRFHDELDPEVLTCPLAEDLVALIRALDLRLPDSLVALSRTR
jgi:RluA family pseudouridine synthase